MSIFIPLFPLNLVAFPGEKLNLHIFEPRYIQLIEDCLEAGLSFGIPSFVHNRIEFGTEVNIETVVKRYDDRRMDIKTIGARIIRIKEFINPLEGKLYAGGEVVPLENKSDSTLTLKEEMITLIKRLYQSLDMVTEVKVQDDTLAFDVAHHIGLSLEEEYELMQLESEKERQMYIIAHLKKAIPVVKNMEETKTRIKLNGHFKHFDPLNF